jgi:hypothetical protein
MFSTLSLTPKWITPADAQRLLAATEVVNEAINPEKLNPPVDPIRVSAFAAAMIDGRWRLNGKTIVLDSSGAVLNGRHRLLACVEADCAFETVIVEGVCRDARFTIETEIRSLGDVLYMMGEQNPWLLASTLTSLIGSELEDPDFDFAVSGMQMYLETYPQVREHVNSIAASCGLTSPTPPPSIDLDNELVG